MKTLLSKLGDSLTACFKHDERHHHCDCCAIPETPCPPRCVGELRWKIERGSEAKGTIVVRNVGRVARDFQLTATPLAGHSPGSAALKVQPASAHLQPGDSQLVSVELLDSAELRACQDYQAEVLIRGAWEQCVRVHVEVERDPFDSVSIEQSDALASKVLHAEHVKARIDWKLQPGVIPEAAVTIHNTGGSLCTLNFETAPLIGMEAPGAALALTPDSMQLPAGHTGVLRVKLQGTEALTSGQGYHSSITVRGFYRQRVDVEAFVKPSASDHAEVEQGEAPTRRRTHHWYDHFQCTEGCTPG